MMAWPATQITLADALERERILLEDVALWCEATGQHLPNLAAGLTAAAEKLRREAKGRTAVSEESG
jgi:hypothetical protein